MWILTNSESQWRAYTICTENGAKSDFSSYFSMITKYFWYFEYDIMNNSDKQAFVQTEHQIWNILLNFIIHRIRKN